MSGGSGNEHKDRKEWLKNAAKLVEAEMKRRGFGDHKITFTLKEDGRAA